MTLLTFMIEFFAVIGLYYFIKNTGTFLLRKRRVYGRYKELN